MILFWKCCFLLPVFGLPIAASHETGDAPRIWVSDYLHYSSDSTKFHNIMPNEYNAFRYATKADTEFINKTGPLNYTASAHLITAIAFSCESDSPVVWLSPNPQFEKKYPKYFGARASLFNETLELPLNKFFRSDFSFAVDTLGDVSPLMGTCVTTTSPEKSATFYLHVKYPKRSHDRDNSEEDDKRDRDRDYGVQSPLRPIEPPPGAKISTHRRVSKKASAHVYSTTYRSEGHTHITAVVACCGERGPPVVTAFECGPVGGKRMLWAALQHSKAKLKSRAIQSDDDDDRCSSKGFKVVPSVIVYCKGKGVDVFDEYVAVFPRDLYESKAVYDFIPVGNLEDIEIQRKMLVRLARRRNLNRVRMPDSTEVGVIFKTDPETRSSLLTSVLQKLVARSPWNDLEELAPSKDKTEELAEGEEVQVVCVYLNYFYAGGGKLRLNWRNGSRTMIPVGRSDNVVINMRPDKPFEFNPNWDGVQHRVVGKVIKVHPEMESVDCFAPEMKGVGWGRSSIDVNPIRSAIPPKFVGPQVDVIELELNETGLGFSCEVSLFPVRDIAVFRDGDTRIENWAAISVSTDTSRVLSPDFTVKKTVTFWLVTEDVYGDYQCVAENHAGRAIKRFEVVPMKSR